MTTTTIIKQQNKCGSYGGCEDGYGFYSRGEIRVGTSDLGHMGEDDHHDHDHDQDQSRSSSSSGTDDDLDLEIQLPFQFQYSTSSDMRVIDAPSPRRIASGVWFVLQASSNQDGRMTVGLVMKYLVNKLKLNSESEIELTCRGLQLLPFFTLLHVRDSIWSASRDALTLLSDSSTTDHLMILCYGRSAG
ncbi:hypothetical protein Sjap_016611 [Stephania japonica]|uniref:Uncharacterized protein n=1 Tax=Stephania japonica TaxID=461633 RepID=A0AAP0ILB4_9MAGN